VRREFGHRHVERGGEPPLRVDVIRVIARRREAHAPSAGDGEVAGIARAKGVAALSYALQVPQHAGANAFEERADRGSRTLARTKRELAPAAHRLLEGMRRE